MRSTFPKAMLRATALACASLLFAAGLASAANVYLQTQSFLKTLPNGASPDIDVPMWGFASCDSTFTMCDPVAAPGPQIDLTTADTLTIHVQNTLPVPVSILIPGQAGGGDPVMMMDGHLPARMRVHSLTHEVPASDGVTHGTGTYSWSSLKAGTYLYQSGSYPSLQVPMGLYGALVVVADPSGDAYPGVSPDDEALLLFSEIDPIQNQRVADVAAGGPPSEVCESLADWMPGMTSDYPCTVDYNPAYLLVNGETSVELPAVAQGANVLLRLLNAGLRSHTPAFVGLELGLIAEDGNPYPGLIREQAEALLPAGKTLDALVEVPADDVTFALFDRMPELTLPDGDSLVDLPVGAGSTPPTPTALAMNDTYAVPEDASPYSSAGSVLDNDTGLMSPVVVSGPANGTLVLASDGTFDYTPNPDFSGADVFTYSATDGSNDYPAQVTLNVSFENDAPTANDDGPYVNTIGMDIAVDADHGVLGNDQDADGDVLTAVLEGTPAGVTLHPDGSFEYTGGAATSFTYHANDGSSNSASATVTLDINPVANITLTVQDPDGVVLDPTEGGYRWLVQEDAMFGSDPYAPAPVDQQLSLNFHKSYMPVVASGCTGTLCDPDNESVPIAAFIDVALDPTKRYYVSVLPNDAGSGTGHSLGGAQVLPGATAVTVVVNNQPIPSAQISILVFEDNNPINGVPEPDEPGLGGWEISLEDAGGRYGQNGGTMSQDAFGEPLKNWLPCAPEAPGNAVGVILTCPDGTALIKNLPPGKYGVFVVPPAEIRETETWTQTSTLEGTKINDTWVKANEPPYFVELGAFGYHGFFGFVNPDNLPSPAMGNTVSGTVTMFHDPRPPGTPGIVDSGSYNSLGAYTRPWVGINANAGTGPAIQAVQANEDGSFEIPNVPDGTQELVVWDTYLDQVIAFLTVTVAGGPVNLENVPVNSWFTRQEHNVFLDANQNGIREEGEYGLPDQAVNLRWRDGTIFQSYPTDTTGFVPFDQVFPFFAWQVAEIDYTRFKPTGVTVTVDAGGIDADNDGIDDGLNNAYMGLLNPQDESPRTDTEPFPVLLEAFQGFPGQNTFFDWGKAPYAPGENGGIAGIVFYGSTRGENDPRLTVGDTWEPGIPGVKVRLYREVATDLEGGTALALVDEVETDSWDASPPLHCPGEDPTDPFTTETLGSENLFRCYDGWRNWNQAQPGVFDGGYAFTDIPPGKYVVEVVVPPGYELIKEENKNVDFGDAFEMAPVAMLLPGGALLAIVPDQATVLAALSAEPGLIQPPCVGEDHLVPETLSLFPGDVDTYAPFANTMRPLCNRKEVILSDQSQAAADFHLFTATPIAAQFYGLITDDISVETNPASPQFGEQWSPAYLPYSIRDFKGHVVYRGYTDAFGHYDGVLPSTFSANVPIPSGYSPAMMTACLNDPGPVPDPNWNDPNAPPPLIVDPLSNPSYGVFCYTLQFMPGTTTYLDTPILPTSAFAAGFNPPDCAFPNGTPGIASVGVDGGDPGPLVAPGGTLVIESLGNAAEVPNPAYEGPLAPAPYDEPTITRNYGFGPGGGMSRGTVELVESDGTRHELVTLNGGNGWNPNTIRAIAPASPMTGRLVVTRGDGMNAGNSTITSVTVTVGNETPIRVPGDYPTIQAAIDNMDTAPGSLILVAPGTYDELVVMWKPVRLQGAGIGATVINAVKVPADKLEAWITKVDGLINGGAVDLLPDQPLGPEIGNAGLLVTELGAGITVLACSPDSEMCSVHFSDYPSRIDGFTITGADGGGGIFVNGYAHNLEISNNQITHNSGTLHGGIRVGHPFLPLTDLAPPFAFNTGLNIHHNAITLNGSLGEQSAGGGVAMCTGSDDYVISHNFVCGNYTEGDGGGIGHLGVSDNGLIEFNQVLFNQSRNQGLTQHGGGIVVAGEPATAGALTLGAGNVTVDSNLVQGNQAGSGHGGGFRAQAVNGTDEASTPWTLTLTNNMIVNNHAAWSGGGISLQDTTHASILNNTIANNDSTATTGGLVLGGSVPQPSGISAEPHSLALAAAVGAGFSDPTLVNNIVWHNRAFYYDGAVLQPELNPASVGACAPGAVYWDLGVLGEPQTTPALQLSPTYSVLTDTTGYAGSNNVAADPSFLSEYCNGARTLSTAGPMQATGSFGEGGNFLDTRYGPLTLDWPGPGDPPNYHIGFDSSGLDVGAGVPPAPGVDFDADTRPFGPEVDIGADENTMGGFCSGNTTGGAGPGGRCLEDTDCLPNGGPMASRGTCDEPGPSFLSVRRSR